LTRIIEKRLSLHKTLKKQQQNNDTLKFQISQLQALANIGTTTCMIAHEINNLLTPLGNYAELALNNIDDKMLVEKALRKTARNCLQAGKIMDSMLAVANGETEEKKDSKLSILVDDIFTCLCRDFSKDRITVNIQIPPDLTIWAVPVQIQQVLMNLILNARDAMLPKGGVLTIKSHETPQAVQIEISDTGCGIPPNDLKNIFEPFFTTKDDKKSANETSGCGLGLTFCKKVVDVHNGSIKVESLPGRGTVFQLSIPKFSEDDPA